jgi:hypothetical protein
MGYQKFQFFKQRAAPLGGLLVIPDYITGQEIIIDSGCGLGVAD